MSACHLVATMHAWSCHLPNGVTGYFRIVAAHGVLGLRMLGAVA